MQKANAFSSTNKVFNQLSIGLLCFSVLVGSILRFWNLDKESFWVDEIFSALAATSASIKEMLAIFVIGDVHPPLYYTLLMGWTRIFGSSDWALRSSSALVSIVAFFFMYYQTKKVFGRQVATLATLLLIFSTASIAYAQELRVYSLLLLFSVITTLLWLHVVYRFQSGIVARDFVIYTVVAVITSYLHYFGFLLIGFQVGYLIVLGLLYRRYYKQVGLVVVGWLTLFLPWFFYHLSSLTRCCGGHFWVKRLPFMVFYKEFIAFVFFCGHPERFHYRRIFFISLIVLAALHIVRSRNKLNLTQVKARLNSLVPLMYVMIVPCIVLFVVSYHTPLLEVRFLIILLPAFYLGLAYFLNATLSYKAAFMLVFAIWGSLACIYAVRAGNKFGKQQRRQATEYALQSANEHAVIVVLKDNNQPINMDQYYLTQLLPYYGRRSISYCEGSSKAIKACIETTKRAQVPLIILCTSMPTLPVDIEEMLRQQAETYAVKKFLYASVYVCTF